MAIVQDLLLSFYLLGQGWAINLVYGLLWHWGCIQWRGASSNQWKKKQVLVKLVSALTFTVISWNKFQIEHTGW